MRTLATEELLRRAAAALAARDVDGLVSLYADEGVFEDVPSGESHAGTAAIRAMFEALFAPPHTRFRVAAVRSAGTWGVLEWVWSGQTRRSGAPFEVRGASVLEVAGSKVMKETIYYDPAPALR